MTLRKRSLAALGVMLGCAALVVGLLGAEGVLQGPLGSTGADGTTFVLRIFAEFASAVLLIALALVCLYAATRSVRISRPGATMGNHHAVTL